MAVAHQHLPIHVRLNSMMLFDLPLHWLRHPNPKVTAQPFEACTLTQPPAQAYVSCVYFDIL